MFYWSYLYKKRFIHRVTNTFLTLKLAVIWIIVSDVYNGVFFTFKDLCPVLLRNSIYCFSDMSSTGNIAFPEASVTLENAKNQSQN